MKAAQTQLERLALDPLVSLEGVLLGQAHGRPSVPGGPDGASITGLAGKQPRFALLGIAVPAPPDLVGEPSGWTRSGVRPVAEAGEHSD